MINLPKEVQQQNQQWDGIPMPILILYQGCQIGILDAKFYNFGIF